VDIAPGKPLNVLLQNWSEQDRSYFQNCQQYIYALAKVESLDWLEKDEAPESATALVGEMKILIPLAGMIDKEAESARLEKEISKEETNLEKTLAKLSNPNFADKAPKEIVDKQKKQAEEQQTKLKQLKEQLQKIKSL